MSKTFIVWMDACRPQSISECVINSANYCVTYCVIYCVTYSASCWLTYTPSHNAQPFAPPFALPIASPIVLAISERTHHWESDFPSGSSDNPKPAGEKGTSFFQVYWVSWFYLQIYEVSRVVRIFVFYLFGVFSF